MSSTGGTSSSPARVPFQFPFNPPAIALPVTRADYFTRDLSQQQKDLYLGGAVKLIAGLFSLASVYQLYRSTRARREAATANQQQHESRASSSPRQLQPSALQLATSSSSSSALSSANFNPPTPTHEFTEATSSSSLDPFASPASIRRSTLPPESYIDTVRKKPRQSTVSPNRPTLAGSRPSDYAPRTTPPFAIGIITPRSLERYGILLKQGFDEVLQREQGAKQIILSRIELFVPAADESLSAFSARVRAANLDILLLQYHGSWNEEVVAFLDYGFLPRILLLHRPEEILERHEQHIFKEKQFNIVNLLRDVECAVVLGEAARPALLKVFPPSNPGNVCVVPHGFSALDAELVRVRKLSPVTVVGAMTNFNDMRWLSDLLQLNQVIQSTAQAQQATAASKKGKKTPTANVVVYAAGNFQTYLDLKSKTPIDQYAILTQQFPDKIALHSKDEFLAAEERGEVTDVASLKAYLWKLSDSGKRVVVCKGDLFDSPLHSQVFDFSTQLYRELLKDFAPKVEYSGALHAAPGSTLPIVFECPSMGDVEIEGMTLIIVPYGRESSCCSSESFPQCCPWYEKIEHCPDFQPAVDAIFRYIATPSHYQSHRQATFAAAQQLTMRHVASQYQQIVKQLMDIE